MLWLHKSGEHWCPHSYVFLPSSRVHETSTLKKGTTGSASIWRWHLDTTAQFSMATTREILPNLIQGTIGKNRKSNPPLASVCAHTFREPRYSPPAANRGKGGWAVSWRLKVKLSLGFTVAFCSMISNQLRVASEAGLHCNHHNKDLPQKPRRFKNHLRIPLKLRGFKNHFHSKKLIFISFWWNQHETIASHYYWGAEVITCFFVQHREFN